MNHSHHTPNLLPWKKDAEWIVLAGNPNVGKSVLFHGLTNMYVDVSNFPGTTLEIYHGLWKDKMIIDTPGIYGISSFNDEERIARDIILQADVIVNVVNAVNLERDLFLTQHLIDTGIPVLVVLNMIDEAERRGLRIDAEILSRQLGVPVVESIATRKSNIDRIKAAIPNASPGRMTPLVKQMLSSASELNKGTQGERLLALEGDPVISERLGIQPFSHMEEIYMARREYVNTISASSVKHSYTGAGLDVKLGHWLLRPIIGILFLLAMLLLMYQVIGVYIAGDVIAITEGIVMQGYYVPFIVSFITDMLSIPEKGWIATILVGEFGLLTMTIVYVFGLLMPLVFSFYLFLSLFEDSGYLPRLAALVDRLMQFLGLNGRAIIPMILGLGCVTMATITTRLLGSERERKIAIYLLGLAIPCSAQLAVIVSLLAGVGLGFTILYVYVIFLLLAFVGGVLDRGLKGESSKLLIDIPPMRIPRPYNVLKKTSIKTYHFLREALPLFAVGALIISVFQITGILNKLSALLSPLVVGWLGLPMEASTAFIMGIVRRDFGAAGLIDMSLSSGQTVVSLITITLFVPCIASILVIFKELIKKEALLMWLSTFVVSFTVGGLINQALKLFSANSGTQQVTGTMALLILSYIAATLLIRLLIPKRGGTTHADI